MAISLNDCIASLTHQQMDAIGLLMRGENAVQTAKTLGINHRTLQRWLVDERFSTLLNAAKKFFWEKALLDLVSSSSEVTKQLVEMIKNTPDERLRLEAIKTFFAISSRAMEFETVHNLQKTERYNNTLPKYDPGVRNGGEVGSEESTSKSELIRLIAAQQAIAPTEATKIPLNSADLKDEHLQEVKERLELKPYTSLSYDSKTGKSTEEIRFVISDSSNV